MKYRFLALMAVFIMLLGITVSASSYEFIISSNDNFISTQSDENLTAISKKLNTTPKDLNSYLQENDIIYIAVSRDNKSQIKISALTDNFSSKVGDISRVDDAGMKEFVASVGKNANPPAEIIENNGRKYVCIKSTLTDDNGVYTVTQYVTISNNKTYYFSCSNPGEETSADIIEMFKSFKLKDVSDNNGAESETDWKHIIIYLGAAVFGVIAIILIISVVITYLQSKKEIDCKIEIENEVEENEN